MGGIFPLRPFPLRPPQQYHPISLLLMSSHVEFVKNIQHIWCTKIPIVFLQNPAPAAGFIPLLSYYLQGFIVTNSYQLMDFLHPQEVAVLKPVVSQNSIQCQRRVVRSKARPDKTRSILHGYFNPLVFWYHLFTNQQRI